jgi:hypothetical protein
MMTLALMTLALLQTDGVKLRYASDKSAKDKVYYEMRLGIKIDGTDQLANFVRSMHPFLSMEKLLLRAEGNSQVASKNRRKIDFEEARVELRYDDEEHEFEFQKGQVPEDDKNKLRQMMWYLAAGGKNFTLTPEGEFRNDDLTQDHNGEAMDLIGLAITRMPDKEVKQGDTWERSWKGSRSEKGKQAKFDFKQKVTLEKLEEKDGKKIATLAGELTGKLDGGKDPAAEEGWTKCEGKTKLVLEVETGRVLATEGKGAVTAYFKNTAENGGKQEIKLNFSVEGKMTVK